MYGAILGDMIGTSYGFGRGKKTKNFLLFSKRSEFTGSTVMTVAVADALLGTMPDSSESVSGDDFAASMQRWGRKYPDAGYGGMFYQWLWKKHPEPYGSFGNGSALRVSPVGWLYGSIEKTIRIAELTAAVTHNHPEGIRGAKAVAGSIFLAKTGHSKEEIRKEIMQESGYDLSGTFGEFRPVYRHEESCQQTVRMAIIAFMEGNGFEDVIRTAVSFGGDCAVLASIAGSIAEAFYAVPEEMKTECRKRLPQDMLEVVDRFYKRIPMVSKSVIGTARQAV